MHQLKPPKRCTVSHAVHRGFSSPVQWFFLHRFFAKSNLLKWKSCNGPNRNRCVRNFFFHYFQHDDGNQWHIRFVSAGFTRTRFGNFGSRWCTKYATIIPIILWPLCYMFCCIKKIIIVVRKKHDDKLMYSVKFRFDQELFNSWKKREQHEKPKKKILIIPIWMCYIILFTHCAAAFHWIKFVNFLSEIKSEKLHFHFFFHIMLPLLGMCDSHNFLHFTIPHCVLAATRYKSSKNVGI